jgi:hypothetical protein
MQCSKCGKTGFVTVGKKRYCSNCGSPVEAGRPAAMSDIRQNAAPPQPTAAAQLHGPQVGLKVGVLDLRPKAPESTASTSPTAAAAPKPVITLIKPSVPIRPQIPQVIQAKPSTTTTGQDNARLQRAAVIPKSQLLKKFPQNGRVVAPTDAPELPNAVAAHIDAMQKMADAQSGPARPRAKELSSAIAAAKPKPSPLSIAAAITAIAIMGGFIWLQNVPKLAFRTAAGKAGIDATLPNYLPDSYRQTGPAAAQSGQLSLQFSSPSIPEPLNITQRATDWDADSLRENYVAKQAANFLAVPGQGLTIYLFNGNQAAWVNHGIWYSITGTSHLSRDQVLKIAYSL